MGQRPQSKAWRRWVIGLGLLSFACMGCSPGMLGFLLQDDKRDPAIPLPCKKDKDEVTVAIITSASPTLGMDPSFAGAERELATLITRRMTAETAKEDHPIRVVEQSMIFRMIFEVAYVPYKWPILSIPRWG